MTKVNIIDTMQDGQINISDAKEYNWYKVVDYPHNKSFVGRIGILIFTEMYNGETNNWYTLKTLVTTYGEKFSHDDFVLQPISKITITAE